MMGNDKWICKVCGREHPGKPKKNESCNVNGCKGRFQHYYKCRVCGEWFHSVGAKVCASCAEKGFSGWRSGSFVAVCAECGKEFRRPRANAKGKKLFCDKNCQREYEKTRWVERTCKECGKTFRIRKTTLAESNATGNYCSRECYIQSMRVDGPRSKGDFSRVKRLHFSGVQFCAICGTQKRIHIHHIIPYRLTHDNSVGNLIPLCTTHHVQIEKAWKPFVEMFDNPNDAKPYVQNVLRERQAITMCHIRSLLDGRM